MKILFIQNRLLFPADTGGKIRTLMVLKHLAQWHDVTYLCNAEPGQSAEAEQMRALGVKLEVVERRPIQRGSLRFWTQLAGNLLSSLPLSIVKNFDPAMERRARELTSRERFDLVVCDFLHTVLYAQAIRGVPKVLFQHNVEAQILQRHAENDKGRLRRAYMGLQYRRTRRFEDESGRAFDGVIAVSVQDKTKFEREYGWKNVEAIDTAVDLEYFTPGNGEEKQDRVAFVGSLDWMPNEDGVIRFVQTVWPRIRKAKPEATFAIVGRNPSAAVKRLAEAPGVEVAGSVPDVRPYLNEASVVVVPLHVGGGTRLKIFAAMAMAKAVVSTTLGAEGLPVEHGRELLIANEDARLAQAVVELFDDPARRRMLGQNAWELVRTQYGSEAIARQFEAICLKVAGKSEHPGTATASRPGATLRHVATSEPAKH